MTRRTDRLEKPTSSNPTEVQTAPPTPTQTDTPATPESGRLPYEQHAAGLPAWKFAALKAFTGWAAGRKVTAEQFDKALTDATNEVIQ